MLRESQAGLSHHWRNPRGLLLLAGLLVLLSMVNGCAFVRGEVGEPFPEDRIETIEKGITNRQEVAQQFGAPDAIGKSLYSVLPQTLELEIDLSCFVGFIRWLAEHAGLTVKETEQGFFAFENFIAIPIIGDPVISADDEAVRTLLQCPLKGSGSFKDLYVLI